MITISEKSEINGFVQFFGIVYNNTKFINHYVGKILFQQIHIKSIVTFISDEVNEAESMLKNRQIIFGIFSESIG